MPDDPERPIASPDAESPPRPAGAPLPSAAAWMVALGFVLYFVPILNGLLGGVVGGYLAGSRPRALRAALLALPPLGVGLWGLLGPLGGPLFEFFDSLQPWGWALLSVAGTVIGAAIGGAAGEGARFSRGGGLDAIAAAERHPH